MIPLNLTREDVVRMRASIGKEDDIHNANDKMCYDWITMFDELTHLNNAIEGAMNDVEESLKEMDETHSNSNSFCQGTRYFLDILRRHLGKE